MQSTGGQCEEHRSGDAGVSRAYSRAAAEQRVQLTRNGMIELFLYGLTHHSQTDQRIIPPCHPTVYPRPSE
jgi:hypothetical protein